MHSLRVRVSCALVAGVYLHACASATVIHSVPEGAKLYADGEYKGVTPYAYSDTKIVGSTTQLRLVMEGYQEAVVSLQRNEQFSPGACFCGVLFFFPFLWIMSYRAEHRYELTPLQPRTDYALPPSYTIFGRVTEGQDIVNAIATSKTDRGDRPIEEVKMEKVTIE